ncbi:MAG: PilZ domain-containing protein [Desulfatitalea sp.]|nr:PilZ domain-containing protein [Desulfatitalea sp.]
MEDVQAEAAKAVSGSTPRVFGERRLYERKKCAFSVGISGRNIQFRGLLRDLSLGGALVESPPEQNFRIGQEVVLNIPFSQKQGYVALRGKVARVKYNAVGIMFAKAKS